MGSKRDCRHPKSTTFSQLRRLEVKLRMSFSKRSSRSARTDWCSSGVHPVSRRTHASSIIPQEHVRARACINKWQGIWIATVTSSCIPSVDFLWPMWSENLLFLHHLLPFEHVLRSRATNCFPAWRLAEECPAPLLYFREQGHIIFLAFLQSYTSRHNDLSPCRYIGNCFAAFTAWTSDVVKDRTFKHHIFIARTHNLFSGCQVRVMPTRTHAAGSKVVAIVHFLPPSRRLMEESWLGYVTIATHQHHEDWPLY